MEQQSQVKSKENEIKPNEIFSFNLWIFITVAYFFYMSLCLIPHSFFAQTLNLAFLPRQYWLIAVPTHILVTLIYIFCFVKCFELIRTIDNPPIKDVFYKELSIKEMTKEINIDYTEGILPDCGDINEDIIKEVLNNDKKNK